MRSDPERFRARASVTARAESLDRHVEMILRRLRMAIIHAGDKREPGAVLRAAANPRPWKSYAAVAGDIAAAMRRIGIREDVLVVADDMRLPEALVQQKTHLAWLNTAGVQGRSAIAHAPGMLEMLGIPYIGHEPMTAALLDNKHAFKRQLSAAGIATASSYLVRPSSDGFRPSENEDFRRAFASYRGPFVVKPVAGRASLHVTFVETILELREAVTAIQRVTNAPVLIERFLGGAEYCVAVAGPVVARGGRLTRLDRPFVFSALERVLAPGEHVFTSMDVKPISGERARVLEPSRDGAVLRKLEALATSVFDEFDLDTLVRLDVRADEAGELYVLEANPKPDLKAPGVGETSLVAIGLDMLGISYDDLVLSLFANRIDALVRDRDEMICRMAGIA